MTVNHQELLEILEKRVRDRFQEKSWPGSFYFVPGNNLRGREVLWGRRIH